MNKTMDGFSILRNLTTFTNIKNVHHLLSENSNIPIHSNEICQTNELVCSHNYDSKCIIIGPYL